MKFMIKCFEANYPESLGAVLVYKSPWIFHGRSILVPPCVSITWLTFLGIWKIIKGWLDPVVASKVHFTKTLEELEEFVEKKHIPKELGGNDDWIYHYVEPIPDENRLLTDDSARQQLSEKRAALVREYEATTQQWIRERAPAEATRTKRTQLTDRLRENYWEIDPYIRAKSLYDRTGMLREGGRVQYYGIPEKSPIAKETTSSIPNGPLAAPNRADDLD